MAHPQERISNEELRIANERTNSKFTIPNSTFNHPHIGRPQKSTLAGGGHVSGDINSRKKTPIKMKQMLMDRNISNIKMAEKICHPNGKAISGSAVNLTLNHGYLAGTIPQYREQIEEALRTFGFSEADITTAWEAESNVIQLGVPANTTSHHDELSETLKEAEMLTPTTMKHFHLFRNPFLDDVQQDSDVFMSESHRYAYAAMLDTARNGGFGATTAECGAGKSVIRRKLIAALHEAGDVRVIEPQTIDKGDLTSNHILDAIIYDLDPDAKPKLSKEAKARQVRNALLASSRGGMRHVLIIEEAHDLSVPTMKQLKRLWEIEDGYRKVLGIVLIGQQELRIKLNRQTHPEMREVILRCLINTLDSLNRDDCERYIALKFDRIGKPVDEVLDAECVDEIMSRLTTRVGTPTVYPLYINNLLAKAMNKASEFGAPLVSAEIIKGV